MNIGIITSGGDSPGMNSLIVALVKLFKNKNISYTLFKGGFSGIIKWSIFEETNNFDKCKYQDYGGTFIGAGRLPELQNLNTQQQIVNKLLKNNITHLVVIGGNGSFKGAIALAKCGLNIFAIPGTIDNDVYVSEMSLGFYSALQFNVDAINQIVRCAMSNNRFFIIQVMGGYAGQLAIDSAILSGADYVITHERPWNIRNIKQVIQKAMKKNGFGFMIMPDLLINDLNLFANELEEASGAQIRIEVIGRGQRGAKPSVYDQLFGIKLAERVVDLILKKENNKMIIMKNGKISTLNIIEKIVVKRKKQEHIERQLFSNLSLLKEANNDIKW